MVISMKKWIDIFHQTLIATAGMLFLLGLEGFFYFLTGQGERFYLSWHQPFAILATSVLCSFAIRILPFDRDVKKGSWIASIALHFFINLTIVLAMGHLAKWYADLASLLITVSFYIIIYCLVWAGMIWFSKYEERLINQALAKLRDKE